MATEIENIVRRYQQRHNASETRYSRFNSEIISSTQERQRALIGLLKEHGISDLTDLTALEVGCGTGTNLQELLLLGANPENLVGNELLAERLISARRRLPLSLRLFEGDASALPFADNSFDIVYQSTMFSSILDDNLQANIAMAMWRWVRPGGGILWYDFTLNNPSNPDVRGVPIRRVRDLFPAAEISTRRVTLAPPISRRVVRFHPIMYPIFNLLPILRTHVICFLRKP